MAYKSLLLSLSLTIMVGYAFTAGLTNPNSPLRKMPDWSMIPVAIVVFVLYMIATYWAFKGFGEHKLAALLSLGFCTLGIGVYISVFLMEIGNGKAAPGQYDHDFSRLDPTERSILEQITQNMGLELKDATFTQHWHLAEKGPGFRVCVQKGHITALHFFDRKIPDLSPFSRLPLLGDLYLNNCGLSDMTALRSKKLDRLDLANNNITDLNTLRGCPNIRWLVLRHNQLQNMDGIKWFPKLVSKDLTENPVSR